MKISPKAQWLPSTDQARLELGHAWALGPSSRPCHVSASSLMVCIPSRPTQTGDVELSYIEPCTQIVGLTDSFGQKNAKESALLMRLELVVKAL